MSIPTIFEMEPIGVDGALESVAAYGFCCESCRFKFKIEHPQMRVSEAEEPNSFESGHVCDYCGGELP